MKTYTLTNIHRVNGTRNHGPKNFKPQHGLTMKKLEQIQRKEYAKWLKRHQDMEDWEKKLLSVCLLYQEEQLGTIYPDMLPHNHLLGKLPRVKKKYEPTE